MLIGVGDLKMTTEELALFKSALGADGQASLPGHEDDRGQVQETAQDLLPPNNHEDVDGNGASRSPTPSVRRS